MRKTLCFLLLFCLILPLFAAGAYAAKDYTPYIIEVEISAGDTISDICDSYSIDYYAVKDAILVVNGFADEKALGAVSPGQKIFIPRSRADADSIMALYESTISAVIPSEYVIKVKVEKGETLYSICEAHHLTYSVCREAIKSLNLWSGDFRLDAIYAGQEILLPISDAVAVEISEAVATAVDANISMGLVGNMDLSDNMMLRSFRSGPTLFTDRKAPHTLAEKIVRELEVVTPSVATPVRRLSGGNVQKVLVGREIASAPSILLTAYAVRGLDVNSSYVIYDLLNRQKKAGVGVIYVGEDLDVLLELSDRILVLCGGKVSGIVPGRGADKREIGRMMTSLGGEK